MTNTDVWRAAALSGLFFLILLVIGISPLISRSLNPFIQVLKPIPPLAWMPIARYTIKDSSLSGAWMILDFIIGRLQPRVTYLV